MDARCCGRYELKEADFGNPSDAKVIIDMALELQVPGRDRYDYSGMPEGHAERTAELLISGLQTIRGRVFLAYDGKDCVGIAICQTLFSTWRLKDVLNLQDFYVRPEHRQNGLGKAMLQYLVDAAREAGCCRLNLETQVSNAKARKLYEEFGFVGTDPGDDEAVLQMKMDVV